MLEFSIYGRRTIGELELESSEGVAWISIHDPNDPIADVKFKVPTLELKFHDLEPHHLRFMDGYTMMTPDQAEEVIEFVIEQTNNGVSHILVNCDMGWSRSSGTIVALSNIFNWRDPEPWARYSFFNPYVRNLIIKTYYKMRNGNGRRSFL
ncbi:MAG: hypothetical protein SV686_13915 [Thermodesulfobacteriota bacterium]|nr:hypothetical protein [Thermodesulfobacteriota bacterium]